MMPNVTLLYAEDDLESRNNYAFVLKEYFSEIYLADDGKEALKIYHDKKPDIVLLDINMPVIDGLEVAKTIREKDQEVPILMLTAHSEQNILLQAVSLKLDDYLIKPTSEEKLKEALFNIINKIEKKDTVFIREKLLWNRRNSNLSYNGIKIKLTKKEYKLVEFLLNSVGEYFTNDTLIIEIWDNEIPNDSHDNKLHQLIYRFNKKINDITESKISLIENSYTYGYRIIE